MKKPTLAPVVTLGYTRHMRLTLRGKIVVGIIWVALAWTLAAVLPFWWTKF